LKRRAAVRDPLETPRGLAGLRALGALDVQIRALEGGPSLHRAALEEKSWTSSTCMSRRRW
jgi:hypothetical protein